VIELRHLRHLLALKESGSFKRAAAAVHISQPALTKSIQQAERIYGARLFDRQRGSLNPTAFGRVVIERARRVLAEAEQIRTELGLLRDLAVGQLIVGAGPLWAEALLATALGRMISRHPGLSFLVRALSYHECLQELKSGTIELAVADPTAFASTADLEVISLPTQPIVWFARPDHPLAERRRIRRAELVEYPIVAPELPAWGRKWLEAAQAEARRSESIPRIECESYAFLKKVVRSSNALSAATRYLVADEFTQGRLVELQVVGPKMKTRAGIIHRSGRTLSPAAKLLVSEVEEVARSL